jgi:predicted transposase/invertase (TIGR01784 family)
LRGAPGIYYIRLKGVPIDKTLAIQIMVCSELPDSEFLLKALVPDIDEDMAKKVLEVLSNGIDNSLVRWAEIVIERNLNIIMKAGESMKNSKKVEKVLMEYGYCDKWRQEGKQEGWQEGKQVGELEGWQKGLEEEKRRTASAMMADGMDVNTIARITGLTEDEIRGM